jgi:hypothetical protein
LEGLLLVILAGFAVLFLLVTKDYGATAALFPRVVAAATLAFLAFDLGWQYFLAKKKSAPVRQDAAVVSWWAALALQAGYIALIYIAGFSAATLIYLIACPWQLRYRKWAVTISHAVLLTFTIVYTFNSVFHVRLPKGLLGIPW